MWCFRDVSSCLLSGFHRAILHIFKHNWKTIVINSFFHKLRNLPVLIGMNTIFKSLFKHFPDRGTPTLSIHSLLCVVAAWCHNCDGTRVSWKRRQLQLPTEMRGVSYSTLHRQNVTYNVSPWLWCLQLNILAYIYQERQWTRSPFPYHDHVSCSFFKRHPCLLIMLSNIWLITRHLYIWRSCHPFVLTCQMWNFWRRRSTKTGTVNIKNYNQIQKTEK